MCEYCKNIETGDDYYPIIENELNLGFAGILDIDVALLRNAANTPVIELGICMDYKDSYSTKSFVINYCPVCGEKL